MNQIDKTLKNILGPNTRGGTNDWDFDGVPNNKDCQPRNTMRQDRLGNAAKYLAGKFKQVFKPLK